MMNESVYLVFFSKGGLKEFCAAFSTNEKAQKYINQVRPKKDRIWFYSKPVTLDGWG